MNHSISGGSEEFNRRVRDNQTQRLANLKPAYDFIVCGAGASGSVIARRLAENADCSVLLIEAGGSDEDEAVLNPSLWPTNLGGRRDWGFQAEPNPHLGGRALPMSMGKGLGGGSSINVMVWARGHRANWDYFAEQSGDAGWSYEAVLGIYRRIENWQGAPDPHYRGSSGPVWVQPAQNPSPIADALLSATFLPTPHAPAVPILQLSAAPFESRAEAAHQESDDTALAGCSQCVRIPVHCCRNSQLEFALDPFSHRQRVRAPYDVDRIARRRRASGTQNGRRPCRNTAASAAAP